MKTKRTKSIASFFLVCALLLIAWFAREWAYEVDNMFGKTLLQLIRHLIQIGLVLGWIILVNRRILQDSIRRSLLAVGGLLAFWLYVRTVKWMFFPDFSWQSRYLWYAYYIPMILIPLLGVFLVQYPGKKDSWEIPGKWKLLYIPAFVLIGLIYTNDLHQLVFRFPSGILYFNSTYTYGIGYFLIAGWCLLLGLYFLVILLLKCRAPGRPWFQKLPILVLLGAVVFSILYCLHLVKADLTAVDCILILFLLEACIQSGLIRSNSGYGSLFESALLEAQILDQTDTPRYVSRETVHLDESTRELMANPRNAGLIWKNKRLNCAPIKGGKILWWENIEEILRYTKELEETNARISEQNDLLQAELTLREKQLRIDEQNRLYDQITQEVSSQLALLEQLLSSEQVTGRQRIAQICVLSAYIKRRSNLCILAENEATLFSRELELCILESLESIRLCGIAASLDSHCEGKASTRNLILLYDMVQQIFQQLLPCAGAVLIQLKARQETLYLRLQADCPLHTDFPAANLWQAAGGTLSLRTEGADTWLILQMEGGTK